MTELDDIRALVEVIKQGGLSNAARTLGLAKSVVSRRISRLENDLGTRLLTRSQRGIAPTDAGMEFMLRGERILAELAEARDAAASQRGEIAGRLRLSLPLSFGLRHLAPLLAAWSAAHPALELDAAYSDRHVDLPGERFDAAIRVGVLKDSSLIARLIAPVRLVAVASPEYLESHGEPSLPEQLSGHQCLIYSGPRERMSWRFTGQGREIVVQPTGRFWADSGEALLQAAEAGLGITVLPIFLVAGSLRRGSLVQLFKDYALPAEGLYVLRPQSAYVPARVRALISLLVSHFGDIPPWDQP
jgi:DNA-binding transcriptional LysR family regulator